MYIDSRGKNRKDILTGVFDDVITDEQEKGRDRTVNNYESDTLWGNDTLYAQSEEPKDSLESLGKNNHDDTLFSQAIHLNTIRDEWLRGGEGNDTLQGGQGNDTLSGANGDDLLTDLRGDNLLQGDQGNDTLTGGPGNNTLEGGQGNDSLITQFGNNHVFGGDGNDTLVVYNSSCSCNDETITLSNISSYQHNIQLTGGNGNDVFVIKVNSSLDNLLSNKFGSTNISKASYTQCSGYVRITDFKRGKDKITVNKNKNFYSFEDRKGSTYLYCYKGGLAPKNEFAKGPSVSKDLIAIIVNNTDIDFTDLKFV